MSLIVDYRNALPEEAWALVNHRITTLRYAESPFHAPAVLRSNECSSISEVIDIETERLTPLAKKLNLSVVSFGKYVTDPSVPSDGKVDLSNPLGGELEPAPVSPYKDSVAFNLLSGTIKAVYNAHRGLVNPGRDAIKVYPTYSSGNTGKSTIPFGFARTGGSHRDLSIRQTLRITGNFPKISTDTTIETDLTHQYREVFIQSMKVSIQR